MAGYLDIAKSQIGYVERPVDNVKYWTDLYPPFQGAPWCFCFVSWCLKQAGQLGLIGGKPMYYCPDGVRAARARKQWSRTPSVGALVFYDWGTGEAQHIEFVTSFKGATVNTIGGNYSNKVGAFRHTLSECLGFWHIGGVPHQGGSNMSMLPLRPGKYGAYNLDPAQVSNAAKIVAAGVKMKIPEQGLIIALMTAMQESTLRNLNYGDRDSMGLFQQRPSQGWGTVAQIMDPAYAARKFFSVLITVKGWQAMPMWKAAAAVQRPYEPYEIFYDRWREMAIAVVAACLRTSVIDVDFDEPAVDMLVGTMKAPLPQNIVGAGVERSVHFADEAMAFI